jgi:hypothetical protein
MPKTILTLPEHYAATDRLANADRQLQAALAERRTAVAEARNAGMSWEAIGAQLCMSRQAAWEQFHLDH